jgi:hypothetical protein
MNIAVESILSGHHVVLVAIAYASLRLEPRSPVLYAPPRFFV